MQKIGSAFSLFHHEFLLRKVYSKGTRIQDTGIQHRHKLKVVSIEMRLQTIQCSFKQRFRRSEFVLYLVFEQYHWVS